MSKTAKERKEAKRRRQEDLRQAAQRVEENLRRQEERARSESEVEYVLPEDGPGDDASGDASPRVFGGSAAATPSSSGEAVDASRARNKRDARQLSADDEDEEEADEDRVVLPTDAAATASKAGGGRKRSRKQTKMPWEALKLAVTEEYGEDVCALVSEHDGNAEDPMYTVWLKTVRQTIPVPSHWSQLRSFLANQADRERAVAMIPPEIEALGVERIRAMRDRRANPDQIAFVSAFITGTPLQRKTFQAALTPFGDIFYEGKWCPRMQVVPGKMSQRLRQALGMGVNSPPPWLYALQAMRRLPPAYPSMRVPGLNAPIPPGAQWGHGEGQWGHPPRNENNTFLFPGVMDEADVEGEGMAPVFWGGVPPLRVQPPVAAAPSSTGPASDSREDAVAPGKSAKPASGSGSQRVITPVAFNPVAYSPASAANFVAPITTEYAKVQDMSATSTVALPTVFVAKNTSAPSSAYPQPPPLQQQPRR